MKIFVNVDSRQLQTAVGDSRQVSSLSFKRGDGASVEIVFVRDGSQVELTSGSIVTFGAKLAGKYDSNALVLENGFALTGSGSTASYIGSPSFNTEDLNDALAVDGNDANDIPYLDLMGEITWTDGPTGEPTSTDTFTVRVNNDVLRGDEVGPVDIAGGTPVNEITGAYQVEGLAIDAPSGVTSSGTIDIVFTSAIVAGSPVTVHVTVTAGETQAQVAENCKLALVANAAIFSKFSFSRSASDIYATCRTKPGNDSTLAMEIQNGVAHGISNSTSTDTDAGIAYVPPTPGRLGSMKVESGFLYIVSSVTDGVPYWEKTALSAL